MTEQQSNETGEEEENDDENDEWKEAAETVGSGLASPFAFLGSVFVGILVGVTRKIPGRTRIQKWMINTGIEGLWRTSDGHMIAMTIYGDRVIEPQPAVIDTEEGKITTSNGEDWTYSDVQPYRIGDAPIVWGVADDHEIASPLKARIAEAVDEDWRRVKPVKETDDGITPVQYQSPTQAVADGGTAQRQPFDDVWVDASNPVKDAAGWIVSMGKGYDLHWSQSSAEEMKKQEDRGRLAEMDPSEYDNRAIKLVLLFGAGLALGLFGPALATRIAGSEAGGSTIGMWLQPTLSAFGVM